MNTLECDKLSKIASQSQICGEFLEWLCERYTLVRHGEWIPDRCITTVSTEKLLAEFFGIDTKKLEQEKMAILAAFHESHDENLGIVKGEKAMTVNVQTETQKTVQGMLNKNEPFTSACISHPLIKQDADVRHFDVSQAIRSMWGGGQMIGEDGSSYVRTNITVWPDGPGTVPANAWLYHPDSFDPDGFKPRSRVLVRSGSPDDGDDAVVSLTNTADGSTIQKQCQVQSVETTLNVPRTIIKKIGWEAGDKLAVDIAGSTVVIKKTADTTAKRTVDQEGRIRLHGAAVEALQTTSPMALLVDPTGGEKYIQISAVTTTTSTVPATATADDSDATQPAGKGVSVWG